MGRSNVAQKLDFVDRPGTRSGGRRPIQYGRSARHASWGSDPQFIHIDRRYSRRAADFAGINGLVREPDGTWHGHARASNALETAQMYVAIDRAGHVTAP